jgi:hypothetical protein
MVRFKRRKLLYTVLVFHVRLFCPYQFTHKPLNRTMTHFHRDLLNLTGPNESRLDLIAAHARVACSRFASKNIFTFDESCVAGPYYIYFKMDDTALTRFFVTARVPLFNQLGEKEYLFSIHLLNSPSFLRKCTTSQWACSFSQKKKRLSMITL